MKDIRGFKGINWFNKAAGYYGRNLEGSRRFEKIHVIIDGCRLSWGYIEG